ncbi:flagellar motor switch protein FliN [Candidatus Sumerlaeota bacterium]|nr:flagellar motor switch protein FliN [Candidatus Sumerlaeota bacterium]
MSDENPFENMLGDQGVSDKPREATAQPARAGATKPVVEELRNERPQAQSAGKANGNGVEDGRMNLDFLLDIPLTVKVEVGRTRMLLNDLLQLGPGSVVELNKLVGEPFEILVNDKLIAKGEVVVMNERFGVRLTEIISPIERVRSLS